MALIGHFEDIRRIDNLDRSQPEFWAALTTRNLEGGPFPVDLGRTPVVEATYRCLSSKAMPALVLHYPGGERLIHLEPSREWQTAAALVSHDGFPASLDWMGVRLYSAWRNTESLEIQSIRFRALTPEESAFCAGRISALRSAPPLPASSPALDFFPFGVFMNAQSASRLADLMDVSFHDYWRLAFEDITRHHHNCVALEDASSLDAAAAADLLALAESFDLKIVPLFDWPWKDAGELERQADLMTAPFAKSPSVVAWGANTPPQEEDAGALLALRCHTARTDGLRPLAVPFPDPGALSLHGAMPGLKWFNYLKSDAAWSIGKAVRTHAAVAPEAPLWVTVPGFVSAGGAPRWNSCPEMRLMLNKVLANGARGWFTRAYHNDPVWTGGHCERSLTGPFLTFSDLWAELGNRIERLSVLAPLFMGTPTAEPPLEGWTISVTGHPQSHLPQGMDYGGAYWLRGENFHLCYIVSNDADQVVSVNVSFPGELPGRLEIYDMTAFVRSRGWLPMDHTRHLEMFPGQGQLLMIAEPEVCLEWRDRIALRVLEADRRQVMVDLDLARRYALDIGETEETILSSGRGRRPLEDLVLVHAAREHLLNAIYATPAVIEARSLLIKASSIVCGCDEALSRLHGRGRTELAHEFGVRVIPLAKEMTQLRLRLRRGEGPAIVRECEALAQAGYSLLNEIWAKG